MKIQKHTDRVDSQKYKQTSKRKTKTTLGFHSFQRSDTQINDEGCLLAEMLTKILKTGTVGMIGGLMHYKQSSGSICCKKLLSFQSN